MKPLKLASLLALAMTAGLTPWSPAHSLEVNLTETRPYVEVRVHGQTVRVQRDQNKDNVISGFFAKTSRPCPPFCIHPMQAASGIETVGEVEVFDFMADELRRGEGLLVDARTPDWYARRTIPGAVNIPWTLLAEADPGNAAFIEILHSMGVTANESGGSLLDSIKGLFGDAADTSQWDFHQAKTLLLFCNGPWCDQSPRAIQGLLKIGYPSDRIRYYRGGMNMWEMFGLTTIPGG